MRKWLEELDGSGYFTLLLTKEKLPEHWFDDCPQGNWEEIKKITFPKAASKKNPELVYNRLDTRGNVDKVTELDSSKETVYFIANEFPSVPRREAIANYFWAKYNIVSVSSVENAQAKFIKANPKAKTIRAVIDDRYNEIIDGLTDAQKKWVSENERHAFYNHADASRVEDPEIKLAIEQGAKQEDFHKIIKKIDNIRSAYSQIFNEYVPRIKSEHKDPLENYPLMSLIPSYSCHRAMDEIYLYLNAAYRERQ